MPKKTREQIEQEKQEKARLKAEAKAKKEIEKKYKALLSKYTNTRAIADRNAIHTGWYNSQMAQATEGLASLYFDATSKELGVSAPEELQLLQAYAKSGASLEDALKNPKINNGKINAEKITKLYNAAKVDMDHEEMMLKAADTVIAKSGFPKKLSNSAILKKAQEKGINLPKISKERKKEVQNLQKEYKKKMAAHTKNILSVPKGVDRNATAMMCKPGLSKDEKKKFARESYTFNGKVKIARTFVDDIMKADPTELMNLTPDSYLKNFEKYEYLRQIVFDKTWMEDPKVAAEVFSNQEEKEAFEKYITGMQQSINISKDRLDIQMNELATDVDFDKLDMNTLPQLGQIDPSLNQITVVGMSIKTAELQDSTAKQIASANKTALESTNCKTWMDVYKSKPNPTPMDQIMFKVADPKIAIHSVIDQFGSEFIDTDGDLANTPEHEEYRKQIGSAAKTLLNQVKQYNINLSEDQKAVLDVIAKGGDIHAAREAFIKSVREQYRKDPSPKNFEAFMKATDIQIKDMVDHPAHEYGEGPDSHSMHVDMLNKLDNAKVSAFCNTLGVGTPASSILDKLSKANNVSEFKVILSENPNEISKQNLDTFLNHADHFFSVVKADKNESLKRDQLYDKMLDNMQTAKTTNVEKLKNIADSLGIQTNTPEEAEKVQERAEKIKNVYKESSMQVHRYSRNSEYQLVRQFTGALNLDSLSERNKQILLDAGSKEPKKMAAAYDVMMDIISNFDTSLVSDVRSIDDKIRDAKEIGAYSSIFLDSERLFSDMDKAIQKGDYYIDPEKYQSIKDFAKVASSRLQKTATDFKFMTFGESQVLNFDKITKDQVTAMLGCGDHRTTVFASTVFGSSNKDSISTPQEVSEVRNYMKETMENPDPDRYVWYVANEARIVMAKGYNAITTTPRMSQEKKDRITAQMLKAATKVTYIKGLQSKGVSNSEIKKMLRPKECNEKLDILKDFVAEALDKSNVKDFREVVKRLDGNAIAKHIADKMVEIKKEAAELKAAEAQRQGPTNEKKKENVGMALE